MDDFIDKYMKYNENTEPPYIYHRWTAISAIGALLGRRFFFPFGPNRLFPNEYIMFIGEPGTRKSTAIKLGRKFMRQIGYNTFAANKITKEKFLMDLAGYGEDNEAGTHGVGYEDTVTAKNMNWNEPDKSDPRETYISADEFNEFAQGNPSEFYRMLGDLWDWDDEFAAYESRVKNSKSISIWQPTVSLLGGNTPENFRMAFPAETLGMGFISRLLFIYAERSIRKFSIPPTPRQSDTDDIVTSLNQIYTGHYGEAKLEKEAEMLLDDIYNNWKDIEDSRFKSYGTRRHTQLIKLCLIHAAARCSSTVTVREVIRSNTVLSAAEHNMPRALGEFGKAKHSDVSQKIIEYLSGAYKPVGMKEIWGQVVSDLNSTTELATLMSGLVTADKVQMIPGVGGGYLAKKNVKRVTEFIDWKILTQDERDMIGVR